MFFFRNKHVLVKKSENLNKYGPFFIIFPLPVMLKFTVHITAVHLFTCVAKAVTSRRSREYHVCRLRKSPSGMDGTTYFRAKPTVDCSAFTVSYHVLLGTLFMIFVSNKCSRACKSVTEIRDNAKSFPGAPRIVPTMFFWVHCL